ncbi:MAG: hypothetical protein A2157_02440 [Deltaproteobacteria bacterium RBG_16_47_11]|nr:MAG: hypothetical protein A2157_02440 [Deltaproteobacteria bacterium RBG_16_47_11]
MTFNKQKGKCIEVENSLLLWKRGFLFILSHWLLFLASEKFKREKCPRKKSKGITNNTVVNPFP